MIDQNFVIVGALFNLFGSANYALDTINGKTKPNRVTWFLWALAPLIAFTAQLKAGVGLSSLMTFMVGFGPLVIFLASFINKKAFWKITSLDIVCGLISVLALVLWYITGTGLIAIIFSIVADFIAGIPTIIKSLRDPESESYGVFRNGAISAVITLLTIKHWNFTTYGFAVYILAICAFLYVIIKYKVGPRLFNQPLLNR